MSLLIINFNIFNFEQICSQYFPYKPWSNYNSRILENSFFDNAYNKQATSSAKLKYLKVIATIKVVLTVHYQNRQVLHL